MCAGRLRPATASVAASLTRASPNAFNTSSSKVSVDGGGLMFRGMWSSLFATTFVGRMRRVVSYSPLSATGTRKTLTRAAELGRARSTAAANRSKYSSVTLDIIARMRRSAASGWVPCFSVTSVCAVGISSPYVARNRARHAGLQSPPISAGYSSK